MSNGIPPEESWTLLHPYTGPATNVQTASRGFSSDLTALIRCGKGPFFVKATRNRPGGRRDSLVREALVGPAVKPVAPALLWQAENEGWIALGFEVGEGRRADVEPGDGGSADADDLGLGAADR